MPASTAGLRDVAWELYGEVPERFTSSRNDRAKQARSEGDRELAEQVKAFRKPSVGAWLVNLLVRRLGDEVERVLALGEELRDAQANLDGEELRTLDRQRRELTMTVTSQARSLARELGHKVSDQVSEQVEDTLRAAMADPSAAAAVRSGCLVETLSPSGFGEVEVENAVAVPAMPSRSKPRPSSKKRAREDAKAREALAAAEHDLGEAAQRLGEAQDAARTAQEARRAAEESLQTLGDQLREAERLVAQAQRDEQSAVKEQERAMRDEARAERAVARARAACG